ncbi:MAG: molybdate transport system ATP-binding protein [Rhodothermales bacterium]|jgi:molybdate transport system ATP-binding protein
MSIDLKLALPGLLDVELRFPSEGITAVIGPSGAGKSLLLRSVAGLEPAVGHVRVGEAVWLDESTNRPTHQRAVGVVLQRPGLLPHLTVQGNLEFALRRRGGRDGLSLPEVARLLGIGDLLERRPGRLSGGEAQRVAVARALLTAPRILLLDEPVSALDGAARSEILSLLVRVQSDTGVPMLYVTHDLDEVARIAHHVALLEAGRILGFGALQEMLTRLDLPLAQRGDAESVLTGTVSRYDSGTRVLTVATTAGDFQVVSDPVAAATPVRIRIKARDVSLTLERPGQSSILNILPVNVEAINGADQNKAVVRLSAGGIPVVSHVSHLSVERLGLAPGLALFIQVKSVALLA